MIGVPSRASAPVTGPSAEQTRRHVAVRLLPFVFVLYIINYLDRTSVAYAALGMSRDLGFNDRVLGLGIGIFFLSYVALQIPGAVLAQRWSARGVICTTMIVSGSLTFIAGFAMLMLCAVGTGIFVLSIPAHRSRPSEPVTSS